jgi:hypothetical protein
MQQIEVRVEGQIDESWSDWLGALLITHGERGETLLSGTVRDQAALYGLLVRMSNLGLKLISLTSGASCARRSKEVGEM